MGTSRQCLFRLGTFGDFDIFSSALFTCCKLLSRWAPLLWGSGALAVEEAAGNSQLLSLKFTVAHTLSSTHWGPQWAELALASALWRLPTPTHCLEEAFPPCCVRCVSTGERWWNQRLYVSTPKQPPLHNQKYLILWCLPTLWTSHQLRGYSKSAWPSLVFPLNFLLWIEYG